MHIMYHFQNTVFCVYPQCTHILHNLQDVILGIHF